MWMHNIKKGMNNEGKTQHKWIIDYYIRDSLFLRRSPISLKKNNLRIIVDFHGNILIRENGTRADIFNSNT